MSQGRAGARGPAGRGRSAGAGGARVLVLAGLVGLVGLCGCVPAPRPVGPPAPPPPLVEVPPQEWPVLADDLAVASLEQAASRSLAYLERFDPGRTFVIGEETVRAGELARLTAFLPEQLTTTHDPAALATALAGSVRLMRSTGRDGRGEVLMTGYYEPVLDARHEREPPFVHPIYGLPDDLVTLRPADFGIECSSDRVVGRIDGRRVVPYLERDTIDFGPGLAADAPVLGWVEDLVDVFFLHVQGSGTLRFASGELLRAGYASSNGHPYRSIGRLLLDEGLMSIDEMSMQGIKRFLAERPAERRRVLAHNPSYIFFRPLPAVDGPLGCYEIPLTPGRSIATDRGLFPAPVIGYLSGPLPAEGGGTAPVARFVVNQDTGGAIRGPGRVDVFFGTGPEAGQLAGRTKHKGALYLFLPPRQAPAAPRPASEPAR